MNRDLQLGKTSVEVLDGWHQPVVGVQWQLVEDGGRFYRLPPKDASDRHIDLPPFLDELLAAQIAATSGRRCAHTTYAGLGTEAGEPPCPAGRAHVWLGADGGHPRNSNFARRIFTPATTGWYPKGANKQHGSAKPVLVDVTRCWPGTPLPAWPASLGIPTGPAVHAAMGPRAWACPARPRARVCRFLATSGAGTDAARTTARSQHVDDRGRDPGGAAPRPAWATRWKASKPSTATSPGHARPAQRRPPATLARRPAAASTDRTTLSGRRTRHPAHALARPLRELISGPLHASRFPSAQEA